MSQPVRLKWLVRETDLRAGQRWASLPLLSVSISWGVRRREYHTDDQPRATDLSGYKVCEKGDLVINRMRAFQGALGVASEDGLVSPDYAVLKIADNVDKDWLMYVMHDSEFVSSMAALVRGIGDVDSGNVRTPRLNISDLGRLTIRVPPICDQRAIADFLDRETARIDTLIEEQRRLVSMLQERRDAVWAEGLESASRAAERVPVRRVLGSIVDGPFGSSLTSAHYSDEGARVIRLGNIGINEFRHEDAAFVPLAYAEKLSAHAVVTGDIVIAGLGDDKMPLGRAAVVPEIGPAIVKADCYRARPNGSVLPGYLAWALSAPQTRVQIMMLARGATRARLNTSVVQQVEIPLPNTDMQLALVSAWTERARRIDTLIAETERFVELARERRAAVVTAAVNGQIHVRTREPAQVA